jgi:outer membrane lipoprotein carrier protein
MNKILAAAMLLAFALNVSAQQKTQPRSHAPKKRKAQAVSVSTVAAQAPDPAAQVLARLKDWDTRLETLKADFTQEVDFKEAGLKQSIEGNLSYVKPNLLRIEHVKPVRQVVVTNKTDIWIYKPEDKQVVHTGWETWRKTQDQNFSGILDFGNYASLTEKNNSVVSGGKNGEPFKVRFTPHSGGAYALTLTLSATDYFPLGAELSVEDTVIKTRLTSVEKNGTIDKDIFKFSAPKGAEVLEFKN